MDADFRIGASILMASAGPGQGRPGFLASALTLRLADQAEARRLFGLPAAGGQARRPRAGICWSPVSGMAASPFGWLAGLT
jgi:uncharacterized glyoxalase superfamily protein PhnB